VSDAFGGGSSSSSAGGPGTRYCPVSQRPKSTSAQRLLQNGREAAVAGRPHTGQRLWRSVMLDHPVRARQSRVRPHHQGTPGESRKIRQRDRIGLQRGDHRRGGTQRRQAARLGGQSGGDGA